MLLLGIDTSIKKGILCLGKGEKILATKLLAPHSSSKQILPFLNALMEKKGLKIQKLEGIVVSLGPGSFTGLRIGLSLAKSLAFTLKIPLVGIPTLETWAASTSAKGILCPLCRAYGNKFYGAFYKKEGRKIEKLSEYLFFFLKDIGKNREKFSSQKLTFLTLREHRNFILETKKVKNSSLSFLEEPSIIKTLLKLGEEKIKKGEPDEVSTLVPLYVSSPNIRK